MKPVPTIPLDVVLWFEECFPAAHRPQLVDSERDIFYREGALHAVAKLRHEYNVQQEGPPLNPSTSDVVFAPGSNPDEEVEIPFSEGV